METIKFSEWKYFKKYNNYDYELPEYETDGETLKIKYDKDGWICAQFDKKTTDVEPGKVYRISYNLKTDSEFVRLIFGWYDKDGEVLEKGYIGKSGDSITAPEKAFELKITVRFGAYDKKEAEVSDVCVECLGEYKPKNVKLATVAIPNIYYPESQPPEYNLRETIKVIDRLCSREKPDIIALTETFYTRKTLVPLPEMCNPLDCEAIDVIKKKAKQYNTYIAFSFHEEEDGHYYNSGILINRNGEIVGKCHKCHLTMSEYESGLTPGKEIKVFDTEIGKIGIAICWDIFYPECIREMQKQGVDIIINPTAGYMYERINQRCQESGAYIVTSVAASFENSGIFNPLGEMIANAGTNYGYAIAEVDITKPKHMFYLSYPTFTESKNIYLNEARFDLYGQI